MAKVTVYKKSKFATFLSFVGYIIIIYGMYSFYFNDELEVEIELALMLIGLAIKGLGSYIGHKKAQKEEQKNKSE